MFLPGDCAGRVVFHEGREGGLINITHLSYMQAGKCKALQLCSLSPKTKLKGF